MAEQDAGQLPIRLEGVEVHHALETPRREQPKLAQAFFAMLPNGHRYVFEFRHESWYSAKILGLLREHDAALCLSDHHQAPAPWKLTARHVYVRGHGPGGRYKGRYSEKTLNSWADHIQRWRRSGREVFVYFDNDQKSAAPKDAQRLLSLLGG
jgi:uncharacterized protein YecE (DUF72 family)